MVAKASRPDIVINFEKAGVISLFLTIFFLSFPRSWSLYPLSLSLGCGLVLWIINFKAVKDVLIRKWHYIIPPVLYFLIHLISVILQKSSIALLENRLMFLLIPVFGFPLFITGFFSQHIKSMLKILIIGIACISIFLLVRIIFVIKEGSMNMPIVEYIKENNQTVFSLGFSVLEHPTYLALKINSAILVLILFLREWKLRILNIFSLFLLFSVIIFMLASKTGIVVYLVLIVLSIIKLGKETSFRKAIYIIFIPAFIVSSFLIAKRIDRIEWFLHYTGLEITSEKIDFKNIDQRTREWYCAIQLIKEKPFTGFGLGGVEKRMVQEYLKNGFEEEAMQKMNAHNQFLEAQMTFGIAGTLSLLSMLLTPLIFRKRLRYPQLAAGFILMFTFFLMFESMFNRQWGIMFFLLFYFILGVPDTETENNIVPDNP